MKILVCGGAGYIGSHTVKELLDKEYEVVVVDSLETGHKKAVDERAALCIGNISDSAFLEDVFTKHNIDAVIDFAAYSLVGESIKEPAKYFENNVGGTLSLLSKMREHNVKYIVFSSTAATYGEPENIPILESDRTLPTNPYGESKLCVEKILRWFDEAYGIKYSVLRYFNAAGAHKSGTIGEDHFPESHLIPIILQVALEKREFIGVFGDDYPTEDGTCIRDYIHVTDLANAHILSLEKTVEENKSRTYNLGNGKGFSVKEVIEMTRKVTGKEIPEKVEPRRAGDPSILIASSEKIIKELGWQPQYNTLEKIIDSAWQWHKNHPNGFEDR
ncbi:UDP-glucose 4-epimerase GalE [Lachnospiraceae bacterium 46-61]